MKFFITSARSPVPLDWAQKLIHDGHQVVLADSMFFPLGRLCRGIEKYIRLPKPSDSSHRYMEALLEAFYKERADYLLPCYDEIFHIAYAGHPQWLERYAIMPKISILFDMQDKLKFLEHVKHLGVKIPRSQRIIAHHQVQNDFPSWFQSDTSSFNKDGKIIRSLQHVHTLPICEKQPWIQRQYIEGRLISSYSFAWKGTRIGHVSYLPKYGLDGVGGFYFIPTESPKIAEFCRLFIEKHQWHGQIGFDFIEASDAIYVIGCQPRMTGGFHLFCNELDCTVWPPIASALHAQQPVYYRDALFIFFGWDFLLKGKVGELLDDHRHARDILFDKNRNFLPKKATWLSLMEHYYRMFRYNLSLTQAMSIDIEWDFNCHKNNTKSSS